MPNLKSPALDPMTVNAVNTTGYPSHLRAIVKGRFKRRLSPALGLSNFGVNLTTLEPGSGSALRHWHETQDEFVFVVSGELILITDAGEQRLTAGMCAGFPKGKADGHHLVNRSAAPATFLEVGDRTWPDAAHYPDDDLHAKPRGEGSADFGFFHKDGRPYAPGE